MKNFKIVIKYVVTVLLVIPAMWNLDAQTIDSEFSALLETEWAYGTVKDSSQKFELLFEPELKVEFMNNLKLTSTARLRADSDDKLEPGRASQHETSDLSQRIFFGNNADLELREFFFETEAGDSYLILGKQQIVWGKADGLKVLDVVNPQDFREFILDNFNDARIPLWSVNAEIPINDSVLQLIWIPDQTYHILPEQNSLYAFSSPAIVPRVPTGTVVNLKTIEKPDRFIEDADYGLRVTRFINGWDVTVNYLYHFNDTPVLFRTLTIAPQSTVTITPRYERTHLIGGTFSNAFGSLVLRGELGYSTDRYFLSNNASDSNGVLKTNELAYVIGFDWSGIDDSFLSMQIFQSHVLGEQSSFVRDKVDTSVTFLARYNSLNETLISEIFLLHNYNNDDGLIRPKLKYEWTDELAVWIGVDIFYGYANGLFGQFDTNDRILLGMEWGL